MTDVVKHDQDALEASDQTVTLGGKQYQMNPPKMKHLGRIMWLSGLFKKLQEGTKVSDEELDEAEGGLDQTIQELCQGDIDVSSLKLMEKFDALKVLADMTGTSDQIAMAERNMSQSGKAAASGSQSS